MKIKHKLIFNTDCVITIELVRQCPKMTLSGNAHAFLSMRFKCRTLFTLAIAPVYCTLGC